jgi:uncharacterized protein YjbI with pentapeptide repeats
MAPDKKEETFADIASASGVEDSLQNSNNYSSAIEIVEEVEEVEEPDPEETQEDQEELEEGGKKKKKKKVRSPWIDLNNFDLIKDFQAIPRNPFWIIISVLALLIFGLFIAKFIQLQMEENHRLLKGYVMIYKKPPKDFKGKLPADIQEIIDIHHQKKKIEEMKYQLIHDDPRENEPRMSDSYPNTLNDEDLLLILEAQNIGEVYKSGVEKTELMNLSGLDLTKLSYKYMKNFVGANLIATKFDGINFGDLVFRGASLHYAQFVSAEIPRANFMRTKMSYINFYGANLTQSQFIGAVSDKAHFHYANLSESDFNETVFKQSDFSNCKMDFSSARNSYFEGSDFRDASLIGVSFRNSNLKGVSFVNADLRGANFENCDLEGSSFEGADIELANFKNADVTNVNFKNVKNATRAQLEATRFLVSAFNIPPGLIPGKQSWQERYRAPVEAF